MFITEVDMFAQRPFAALVWSGAFERHPRLKYVLTETGVGWVHEKLRVLEFKADNPIFKHFTKNLSLSPSGYFARQCFLGASFLPFPRPLRHAMRRQLMWGSLPHLDCTGRTRPACTYLSTYPEDEVRADPRENAARVYGFEERAAEDCDEIGPTLAQIRDEPDVERAANPSRPSAPPAVRHASSRRRAAVRQQGYEPPRSDVCAAPNRLRHVLQPLPSNLDLLPRAPSSRCSDLSRP